MNCSSREIPPSDWPHILNIMLVAASDGNAYILGCDRAWRWSKCQSLGSGDVFPAQWKDGRIKAVYSTEKDDLNEPGGYTVLSSQVTLSGTRDTARKAVSLILIVRVYEDRAVN